MKLDPYMVARNVLTQGDKIGGKATQRGKSKTLHLAQNEKRSRRLRETNICHVLTIKENCKCYLKIEKYEEVIYFMR